MSNARNAQEPQGAPIQSYDPVRYPQDHVAAILDTPAQLTDALGALTGGFLESELIVLAGQEEAERLDAGTGRTGLLHHVIRIADRLGVLNKEMEVKERYERALREAGHVVLVLAPTEERKRLAADILRDSGGHFIRYFGRFTIEVLGT